MWRKHNFFTPPLMRLLCISLIQPHFDYASSAWYPNLQNKFSDKLQVCQNKCNRFCLSLGDRSHIGIREFKEINWLPVRVRFEQNVTTDIFKQQINWRQSKWMQFLPLLTNAQLKLDHPRINFFSPTITEKVVIRPSLTGSFPLGICSMFLSLIVGPHL